MLTNFQLAYLLRLEDEAWAREDATVDAALDAVRARLATNGAVSRFKSRVDWMVAVDSYAIRIA